MPRKNAPESNAPAIRVPALRGKAVSLAATGEKGKEIRSEPNSDAFKPKAEESKPKVVQSKPKVTASAPAMAPSIEAPAAKAALAAKAKRTKPAKAKHVEAATNGRSILNLNDAVNGSVSADQIAERAYFRWLERGCPFGSPEEDWI